jgi:hypothetical protein
MAPTNSSKTWELLLKRLDSLDSAILEIKNMLSDSETRQAKIAENLRADIIDIYERLNILERQSEVVRELRLSQRIDKLEDKTAGLSGAGELIRFSIPVIISLIAATAAIWRVF